MEVCYTGFEVISNDRLSLITDSPNQYIVMKIFIGKLKKIYNKNW